MKYTLNKKDYIYISLILIIILFGFIVHSTIMDNYATEVSKSKVLIELSNIQASELLANEALTFANSGLEAYTPSY